MLSQAGTLAVGAEGGVWGSTWFLLQISSARGLYWTSVTPMSTSTLK